MEKARPNGLTALCILSWIWMAMVLLSAFSTVSNGRLTDADIRDQKIAILESQTPESIEMMPWVVEETIEFLYISRDNYTAMITIDFVSLIIGMIGVFLMFQLRKIGFHLYIGYSILSVSYWVFYFSDLRMGLFLIGFSVLFTALFVVLYTTQLKKMV